MVDTSLRVDRPRRIVIFFAGPLQVHRTPASQLAVALIGIDAKTQQSLLYVSLSIHCPPVLERLQAHRIAHTPYQACIKRSLHLQTLPVPSTAQNHRCIRVVALLCLEDLDSYSCSFPTPHQASFMWCCCSPNSFQLWMCHCILQASSRQRTASAYCFCFMHIVVLLWKEEFRINLCTQLAAIKWLVFQIEFHTLQTFLPPSPITGHLKPVRSYGWLRS